MDIKEHIREEGRQAGRQEERQMRDKQIVLNMLKKGFEHSVIAKVAEVSTDYIKNLKN